MQENNQNQSLQIAKELNTLGNELKIKVTELLNEVNSYSNTFFNETFIAPNIKNDKDGTLTKKAIQRGESIFDKIYESVNRNEIVSNMGEIVEFILNRFLEMMKEFKDNIQQEKKKLIETNNEIVDNLEKLEKKKFKQSLKSLKDNHMKINLRNSMKQSLKTNIKSFKRQTIEEVHQEIHQKKIYE